MRNAELWEPTKFSDGRKANPTWVGAGSTLVVDLLAPVLLGAVERHARGVIVDLGCGSVPLYRSYAPMAEEVHCLDWSESPHDLRHADILADLSVSLPLANDVADTVVVSDVLEHLPDPQGFLHEIERILKPSGYAILSTPFNYRIHEAPHDYFRFTSFGLRHLASTAGLSVVSCEPVGGALDVLADVIAKSLASAGPIGRVAARVVQGTCRRFGETTLGAALRARSSGQYALEYVTVLKLDAC